MFVWSPVATLQSGVWDFNFSQSGVGILATYYSLVASQYCQSDKGGEKLRIILHIEALNEAHECYTFCKLASID